MLCTISVPMEKMPGQLAVLIHNACIASKSRDNYWQFFESSSYLTKIASFDAKKALFLNRNEGNTGRNSLRMGKLTNLVDCRFTA